MEEKIVSCDVLVGGSWVIWEAAGTAGSGQPCRIQVPRGGQGHRAEDSEEGTCQKAGRLGGGGSISSLIHWKPCTFPKHQRRLLSNGDFSVLNRCLPEITVESSTTYCFEVSRPGTPLFLWSVVGLQLVCF